MNEYVDERNQHHKAIGKRRLVYFFLTFSSVIVLDALYFQLYMERKDAVFGQVIGITSSL